MSQISSRQTLRFEWQDEKRVFTADDSPLTVGRLKRCDVTVVSPLISREHLRVSWDGGQWHVRDISTNGAFADSRMPEEWALDDNATLYLGAKNGPRLFVAVVRADASGEVNETDIEHGAKAGSNIEHGGGVGLISDNRDAESGDEPYEAANVIEDSVLAQSTITQPVNNSQRRSSTLTKPIFSEANKSGVNSKKPKQVSVAGSAASVVAKTNDVERVVVPESSVAAETKKTGSDGIDESDQVTGEHAATVVGFDPTGPDPAGLADNRQGNEPHDVVPSVTGQIKVPSEIDLREPSVTGQVPVGKTALDPQITGPIEPQSADSVASKAQAVGVVIGSAALAFLVWALISLLI